MGKFSGVAGSRFNFHHWSGLFRPQWQLFFSSQRVRSSFCPAALYISEQAKIKYLSFLTSGGKRWRNQGPWFITMPLYKDQGVGTPWADQANIYTNGYKIKQRNGTTAVPQSCPSCKWWFCQKGKSSFTGRTSNCVHAQWQSSVSKEEELAFHCWSSMNSRIM